MKAFDELLALLSERSFQAREVVLVSGRRSNFYIDCRQTALSGRGHVLIGDQFLAAIERCEAERGRPFDAAAGMTLGGDPLVSSVSMTASLRGRELPALIVRKEAKGHGTGRFVEGDAWIGSGLDVAVLEDVVTTGGSTLKAIAHLKKSGHNPTAVFVLVDREEGGLEAVAEGSGLPVFALYKKTDFMDEGAEL